MMVVLSLRTVCHSKEVASEFSIRNCKMPGSPSARQLSRGMRDSCHEARRKRADRSGNGRIPKTVLRIQLRSLEAQLIVVNVVC